MALDSYLSRSRTFLLSGETKDEGAPVGAIFVLGDYDNTRRRCHQMVINPFRGYSESSRNVCDPSLEHTIKEFSQIDGAFLIRGDGVLMSVGSYIRTKDVGEMPKSGLGARHAAGMAITFSTKALSIVISESTRRISLFKQGKLVMTLIRPPREPTSRSDGKQGCVGCTGWLLRTNGSRRPAAAETGSTVFPINGPTD